MLVDGASKRSICREYGIAFETLQKIIGRERELTREFLRLQTVVPPLLLNALERVLRPGRAVLLERRGGKAVRVAIDESEGGPPRMVRRPPACVGKV